MREGTDPLRIKELGNQVDVCGPDFKIWIMGGHFARLVEKTVKFLTTQTDEPGMLDKPQVDGEKQIGDFNLSWGPIGTNGQTRVELSHGQDEVLQTGGLKSADHKNIDKVIRLFTQIAEDTSLPWPSSDESEDSPLAGE